jgi:uncharacterized membrane protein YdbT with pleckstrin-like domain
MASYIDKSLGDGETVIRRAQFHWLYSLGAWLWVAVPLAGLAAAIIYANKDPANQDIWRTVAVAFVVLLVVGLCIFLKLMMRKWTTELGVTSHRFVEKYGLFTMRTNEIALPNIEGVRIHQSLPGRIFDYGTVRIEGTGVDSVTTPEIADPIGFVRAIQTAKEHVAGLTATPRPNAHPG